MHWPLYRLEDLTEPDRPITHGVVKPGPEDPHNGVKFIRGGDIFEGRLAIDSLRTITPEVSKSYSRTLLSGGELVVSLVGNPGHVAVVPKSLAGANLARQAGLVALRNEIDADFVKFFLMSPQGRAELFAQMTGSVQVVINLHNLRTVRVPLPPLPVQLRIAGILSAYDELMENSQRRIRLLEAMARALYREWFVQSPTNRQWPRKTLGDFVTLKRGYDLPSRARRPGAVPIVSSSGVAGAHDESKVAGPGLVTGRYGTLGEVHLVWEDFWPLNTALYVTDYHGTPLLFAYWLLQEVLSGQTGSAAAVPGVNRNHLHQLVVTAPPATIQRNFHTTVEPLAKQAHALQRQLRNLRCTRDLLLQRLLSGEIEITA